MGISVSNLLFTQNLTILIKMVFSANGKFSIKAFVYPILDKPNIKVCSVIGWPKISNLFQIFFALFHIGVTWALMY